MYYLLKWIKFSVKKQNFKKILEKGILSVPKVGTMIWVCWVCSDCQSDVAFWKLNLLFLDLAAIIKEKNSFSSIINVVPCRRIPI